MSDSQKKSLSNRDPKAGCAIALIIASVIGVLVFMAISTPFRQAGKMVEFTDSEPMEIATKEVLPVPPADLVTRLQAHLTMLEGSSESHQITLSASDLNTAIRSYDEFQELQGTMEVKQITAEAILFNISFKLNKNPLAPDSKKNTRYLNGVMHAVPATKKDELILKVSQVDSTTGTVPEGFLQHLSEYRVMAPYSEHPVLGRIMFATESISLADDQLTLNVNGSKFADPASIKAPEKKNKAKEQMPMLISSFILVLGAFFFISHRRNAKAADAMRKEVAKLDD